VPVIVGTVGIRRHGACVGARRKREAHGECAFRFFLFMLPRATATLALVPGRSVREMSEVIQKRTGSIYNMYD
jgi:hypothetical protein